MTGMEREALDVIAEDEGRLHYYLIAQELGISAHYAYVICKGLERSGYVDFDTFRGICSLTENGKDVVEENRLFKLRTRKENVQRRRREDKKRIAKNAETIRY